MSASEDKQQWIEAGCPEPTAAERVEDGQCSYDKHGDCHGDGEADYRVEFRGQKGKATILMCDDCSRKNRIWVKENELLDSEVTAE